MGGLNAKRSCSAKLVRRDRSLRWDLLLQNRKNHNRANRRITRSTNETCECGQAWIRLTDTDHYPSNGSPTKAMMLSSWEVIMVVLGIVIVVRIVIGIIPGI